MLTKNFERCKFWLLETLKLQLFLNLISFIILIHWGMPISIMSPIGNIIFAPFITIFLILSSVLFFCEVLAISNSWLSYCLENFTHYWLKFLSFGSQNWKITLAEPHFLISILVIILAILALKHKKIQHTHTRIIYLILIFIFLYAYTKLNTSSNTTEMLGHRNRKIEVICNNKQITLYDKGLLEHASWYWVQYTLVPYLVKKFGHCNVETLVVQTKKENKNLIKLLVKRCKIKKVISPAHPELVEGLVCNLLHLTGQKH